MMNLPALGPVPTLSEYETLSTDPKRVSGADRRGEGGPPQISVITVCFNAAATIGATIDSIASQDGVENVEYIVVDGGSTDGTLDILRERSDVITYWISEPDRGISDAFNKGIAIATASIVTHLNADDTAPSGHLAAALELLEAHPTAGFCHGDLRIVTPDGTLRREIPGPVDYRVGLERRMTINHPTTVVRKALYAEHGLFRRELKYAMDYDLVCRFAKAGVEAVHSPQLYADMQNEGVSNVYWRETIGDLLAVRADNGSSPVANVLLGKGLELRIFVRNALENRGLTGLASALRKISNIGSGKPTR